MNNFILASIVTLLALSGTLFFFYFRDVVDEVEQESVLGDCIPINLQVKDILSTSFYVNWETSSPCLGLIKYGDSVDSMEYIAVDETNNAAKTTHSILLKNLKPSSIYYLVVFSEGVEYGVEGTPVIVNTKAF